MTRPDPLAVLRERPERAGVFVDFDGSLAPIVDDPAAARPLPGAAGVLGRLARRLGKVAVISGRPVAFLVDVLAVDGVELAGLYGMERVVEGRVVVDPRAEAYAPTVEAAADEAQRRLAGLAVERKRLAVVIHWRGAPNREGEARAVGEELAARFGLGAFPGRCSLELRPPVDVDKGTTAVTLAAGLEAVLVAGDDRGDLAAFHALDGLVDAGALRAAVKVAVASPEAPPELLTSAHERVEGPAELLELLTGLAERLEERGPAAPPEDGSSARP